MSVAIYPGSFDPITYGHIDIIDRAVLLFDRLIVAIAEQGPKEPLFSIEERLKMLKEILLDRSCVEVAHFNGLLAEYAKSRGVNILIRGLRAVSDFEAELQMALMNSRLVPGLDTIFLMTNESHLYLSSSIVKEVARLGGRVSEFVPSVVEEKLKEKFGYRR